MKKNAPPPTTPSSQCIETLISAEARFRQSFLVETKKTSFDKWITQKPGISILGIGDSPTASVENFKEEILLYFDELASSEHYLAPALLRQLTFFRTVISDKE